jgi:hypothetical protein
MLLVPAESACGSASGKRVASPVTSRVASPTSDDFERTFRELVVGVKKRKNPAIARLIRWLSLDV